MCNCTHGFGYAVSTKLKSDKHFSLRWVTHNYNRKTIALICFDAVIIGCGNTCFLVIIFGEGCIAKTRLVPYTGDADKFIQRRPAMIVTHFANPITLTCVSKLLVRQRMMPLPRFLKFPKCVDVGNRDIFTAVKC